MQQKQSKERQAKGLHIRNMAMTRIRNVSQWTNKKVNQEQFCL